MTDQEKKRRQTIDKTQKLAIEKLANLLELLSPGCPQYYWERSPWGRTCFDGMRTCWRISGAAPRVTRSECWRQWVLNEAREEIKKCKKKQKNK